MRDPAESTRVAASVSTRLTGISRRASRRTGSTRITPRCPGDRRRLPNAHCSGVPPRTTLRCDDLHLVWPDVREQHSAESASAKTGPRCHHISLDLWMWHSHGIRSSTHSRCLRTHFCGWRAGPSLSLLLSPFRSRSRSDTRCSQSDQMLPPHN